MIMIFSYSILFNSHLSESTFQGAHMYRSVEQFTLQNFYYG